MDERKRFIGDWLRGRETVAGLCRRYGVSRKTAYKWIRRYRAEGESGLGERSSAPKDHGRRRSEALVAAVLKLRRRYGWGARKLRVKLAESGIVEPLPAASTIGEMLKRAGKVRPRGLRRHVPPASPELTEAEHANHVWRADHKGWFVTGDGERCEPLTVTDGWSRYLISLTPTRGTGEGPARRAFLAAFRRHGLPEVIRTDNGNPFATASVTGLTRLGKWWLKLGIRHERIMPGHPEQNGGHERFHGTLAQATTSPPARSAAAQRRRLARFLRCYNEERPHEALGQVAPAKLYRPSPRRLPARLPPPCYGAEAQVRRVRSNGEIKWHGRKIYIAELLAGEQVGIIESTLGKTTVWFYAAALGLIDEKSATLQSGPTKRRRRAAPPRRKTRKLSPSYPA